MSMYFFYQEEGKESPWNLAIAADKAKVLREKSPVFATVLNLSAVPADRDWSKVRYDGPFYADFDAEGDIELATEKFQSFLMKLDNELGFDLSHASLFCSGGKGYHVEIPQACFIQKVPANGTPWLPYIYREVAMELIVDTLDLNVYTGKRGRQWRTCGVKRENGNYKVPITFDEVLTMTPELYASLVSAPRSVEAATPPSCNARFAMLFERAREKMMQMMRGKAKRLKAANAVLDPWRQSKRHPPTVLAIMDGTAVAPGAGFQAVAMQLSIYAVSVSMPLDEFLDRCKGLISSHESDSSRYRSASKRREELSRMWEYMNENSLYEFEVNPLLRLLKQGTIAADLGQVDRADVEDEVPRKKVLKESSVDEGDPEADAETGVATTPGPDPMLGMRAGVVHTRNGVYAETEKGMVPICRASFSKLNGVFHAEDPRNLPIGLEMTASMPGRRSVSLSLTNDQVTSSQHLAKVLSAYGFMFQGNDSHAKGLGDYFMSKAMNEKNRIYLYPREGVTVMTNPMDRSKTSTVYLTQDYYISSEDEDSPDYFNLRYKEDQALSPYKIDIHLASDLGPEHIDRLHDLMNFNDRRVVADMLGWFVAAHYRSFYGRVCRQFPLLQVFGEAGSGKTQTVEMLARLHWSTQENVSIKSATSMTAFALDSVASSSSSAPLIIEEYKPTELRMIRGRYEKLKDVLKNAFTGGEIGNRGTLNKGATNHLSVVKSIAAAPICFIGETAETETAIQHRSVTVPMTPSSHTPARRQAFSRLRDDPEALSALGKALMTSCFSIKPDLMQAQVNLIEKALTESCPKNSKGEPVVASRTIFGRAVVVHALSVLKDILKAHFGTEFDREMDAMIDLRSTYKDSDEASRLASQGRSEMAKVLNRLASLSRPSGDARDYNLLHNKDYHLGNGWLELRPEACYDKYRMYLAYVNDHNPLFTTTEAFMRALFDFYPVIDKVCVASPLREDASGEEVYRFDLLRLKDAGVTNFRPY
jgi:hypothetical protein